MNKEQFWEEFNQAAEAIGSDLRITEMTEEGGITAFNTSENTVSLLFGAEAKEEITIIAKMTELGAARGIEAFCLAVDALGPGDPKWRNGLLHRLHLMDGKVAMRNKTQTEARGYVFSFERKVFAKDLFSMRIRKA